MTNQRKDTKIEKSVEAAFDRLLPIPKTPRVYVPKWREPDKLISWVPKGSIGEERYEYRLELFANEILEINDMSTRDLKFSSRGWCYHLEGLRRIDKDEFGACQHAINDCRKIGLLPIDFTAEDQDLTRRFSGVQSRINPGAAMTDLKDDKDRLLEEIPSMVGKFWEDEEYYLMMCVEKGDLINLFGPICREYRIPIVSSKGWYPIMLRGHIARLSKNAQEAGLKPVLLLFYDCDPTGMKITDRFRKNLRDMQRGTKWNPDSLIIERFGLNPDDIDTYGLMWIPNLKTSKGKEVHAPNYVRMMEERYGKGNGRRKCEANAIFKNDDTLDAAEEICRHTIEKYYGADAVDRFTKKDLAIRKELDWVYSDPVWKTFDERIDTIIERFKFTKIEEVEEQPYDSLSDEAREIREVIVDDRHYGECPKCGFQFRYEKRDLERLVRCKSCYTLLRLIMEGD